MYSHLFYLLNVCYDQPRQHIKKQRHYSANKSPSSQSYGFSSSHVWMWELDYKQSWVPKNWCFWTVVLEKTLKSLGLQGELQPVHPKGNQSWIFIGRTEVEAETPILWPPYGKGWLIWKDPDAGKDWRWEEKGMTGDEMVGWHHCLDGHEFEEALGVGNGQGSLAYCSPWGCKESDLTKRLNWTGKEMHLGDLPGSPWQLRLPDWLHRVWVWSLVLVVVQVFSPVQLLVTPWTAAHQASWSFTVSRSLLKLMSIELMMPSNHLILCCPLLLPSNFPSIRVFSSELALCIRWPKY